MQFRPLSAALVAALVPAAALATNGDQMIALSAPTAAMGGATVAAPRDALTVLLNPAGLAHLVGAEEGKGIEEVRMDFGFGLLNPPRKVNGNESDSNWYLMPTGAVTFKATDRLYLGMGMGGVSGMGVNVPDIVSGSPAQPMVTTKQVFRLSPGAALKVNENLTLGASLNIGYQSLALYNAGFSLPQNQQFGFGATLGAVYKVNDKVQLGAVYTSKTDINDMEYNTTSGPVSFDMDMPASYSLGVAFKPSDTLLVEFDIKRIQFADVMDRIAVTGLTGIPSFNFGWDDQTVYAIGVRKIMNDKMTLLAGFNYGKSPIGSEDVATNLGSTAIVEKHASIGLTRKLGKRVRGNFAYTHAFHNKVSNGVQSIEMDQNQYNLNVTYVF
ncbi:MAG: outer membrane protein transport protein [Thiobacillus sp.]|nr:outer membrane protein transport protein [Thiobacillus sp.]